MALPRIPASGSVVVEASVEKTYPDWFLDGLFVRINADGTSNANFRYHPYNYDDDEHHPQPTENQRLISVDDVWAKAGENVVFANAMGAVSLAAAELVAEQDALIASGLFPN